MLHRSTTHREKLVFFLVLGVVTGILGVVLLGDQPGLRLEHYALERSWQGSPVYVDIGEPRIDSKDDIRFLVSTEIFSLRWRGWISVDEGGSYRFSLAADEEAYMRLDGELVLESSAATRRKKESVRRTLEAGVHSIDIGFSQTKNAVLLRTTWKPPRSKTAPLPLGALYARRPVTLRRLLRQVLAPVPVPYRRLIGALLAISGLVSMLAGIQLIHWRSGWLGHAIQRWQQDRRHQKLAFGALLVGLFVLSWLWTRRFTAPLLGGDDVLYVYKALFPTKGEWFFNRYVHVYLLKAFAWIQDGEGFLGSRTYWSFMFAVTLTSLAVAVRSLGPYFQLRTLLAVLFLLLSQGALMGPAGAAFADYTTMMFVTMGVAVYLHHISADGHRGQPGWHALIIGALTVAACKSKETGIILLWLPILFLWTDNTLNLRNFMRKIGYWTAGAAAAWLALMSLDAWLLGDFWYSLKPDLAAMQQIHASQSFNLGRSVRGWMHVLWSSDGSNLRGALSYLWLLVIAAPVAATVARKRIELRLLFLMPLAYMLLLIAVHTRARHIFSSRYLFPVLPICCLFAGALLDYLGLEKASWREILAPRVLAPLLTGSAVLLLLVTPFRLGNLGPAESVGKTAIWASMFLVLAWSAISLFRRQTRPAAIVLMLLFFLGPNFERVRESLAARLIAQRGNLILYPWTAFRDEIEQVRPDTIVVSPQLLHQYRMVGQIATRKLTAGIFFRRDDLDVSQSLMVEPEDEFAIAGRRDLRRWLKQIPDLEGTAVYDASGRLVSVRPRASSAVLETSSTSRPLEVTGLRSLPGAWGGRENYLEMDEEEPVLAEKTHE